MDLIREVVNDGDDTSRGVLQARVQQRRIPEGSIVVEFVVDEAHHGDVKLQKRQHHAVVHILGKRLRQRVRGEPRHLLAVDARLVVDALDGDEHFAQAVRLGDVGLKLGASARDRLTTSAGMPWRLSAGRRAKR